MLDNEYTAKPKRVFPYLGAKNVKAVGITLNPSFADEANLAKYCIKMAVVSQIVTCLIISQYKYLSIFTFDRQLRKSLKIRLFDIY